MPVKYIPYVPETIEGQAILDNFTRTRRVLRYRDNDKPIERIKRGLPLYEVEETETVGEADSGNLLIRGECLSACAYLKDKGIKVDLVYIDPPFASGADYARKVYLRRNPKIAEQLAEKEAEFQKRIEAGEEVEIDEYRAFEEKMYGDIWNKEDYLNWMYENLTAIRSVMSETGSIYVHLNYAIGHYVKILMDEVFGEENFKNEVIWAYSERGISKTNWNRKHDAIYFYTKSDQHYFDYDSVREEYSAESKKKFKYYDEEKKDWYQIRGKNIQGSPVQSADGLLPEDEITYKGLTYRQYMGSGMLAKDWWEIPLVNKAANERVDYATQKPEALLERIITASSGKREDGTPMIVADFFGGSGTTAAVAHRLGRKFITSDVGINSLLTTRDRLKNAGASFTILDVKDGVSLFRNPVQTMDKLKSLITGLRNEDKLDKFWEGAIEDSKEGLMPVYIPNLLNHSTKVLDIPLMNRILNEAIPELPEDIKKVIVYYIDIEDRAALDNFITEKNETYIKIELRDLKEILDEIVLNDVVDYDMREVEGGFEIEFNSFISDRLTQKIEEYNQKRALQNKGKQKSLNEIAEEEETSKKTVKFKPIEISENGLELIEMISLDCANKEGVWKSDVELKIDKNSFVTLNGKKTKKFWNGKIFSKKQPLRMKVRNIAGDESILIL
jgi:adenine-specific DNA-methyltransferase